MEENDLRTEIVRLKRELKRVEQELNILKEASLLFAAQVKELYAFIKPRRHRYPVRVLCIIMRVHHSSYYAWVKCQQASIEKIISAYCFWLNIIECQAMDIMAMRFFI